uniref:C2H2-type domain-containing protein n=1 Tax=Romanomermis culicivorax TaxID=13658 RepID=A0A915KLW6_ROMCU
MTAADEDYTFTCEHCSTPFSYFAQYKSHGVNCDYSPSTSNNVNNNREENEEKKLHYNCSYCKGRFENFADFLSHFKFTKKKHKSCLDTQKTRLDRSRRDDSKN